MTEYKHLVFTIYGTYRLWDKDRIDAIDLPRFVGLFVASILTDVQQSEIKDYAETELTDVQYESMHNRYAFIGF